MPMSLKTHLVELSIDSIPIGVPLQFSLWTSDGALLAKKGYTIDSRKQLERFVERGFTLGIDTDESVVLPHKTIEKTPIHVEPDFHTATLSGKYPDFCAYQLQLNALLRNPDPKNFLKCIDDIQRELSYLVSKSPDAAITAVVNLAARETKYYSAMHVLLVWVVVTTTAKHALRWDDSVIASLGKASLTMNISMLDMQDRMAQQNWPLTKEQSTLVECHPKLSCDMLMKLGVVDPLWLDAVSEHRDQVPGPLLKRSMGRQMGRLIQRADVFGARLSPRLHRQPMPITAAMQASYFDEEHKPDDAGTAIVQTLGVYAPGSYVRLVTGEIAIVVRRQMGSQGEHGKCPVVLVVLNQAREPVAKFIERDTSSPLFRIEGAVGVQDFPQVTIPLLTLLNASEGRRVLI